MRLDYQKTQHSIWHGGLWRIIEASLIFATMVGGYTALRSESSQPSQRRWDSEGPDVLTDPDFYPDFSNNLIPMRTTQRQLLSTNTPALPISAQMAVFELSNLNGLNGFKLDGEVNGDHSGYSVSAAGDVNGDGYADVVIGAPDHASNTGCSYVVFGGRGVDRNGLLLLASLNGTNGFKLEGEGAMLVGESSGWSVSTAGDVNGDGYTDMLIGAPDYNGDADYISYTGRSYVVFGGREVGGNGLLLLASLNGSNGFKLDSEGVGEESGYSVSAAGDVNGDGYADVLIGAPEQDHSYVVFGGPGVGGSGLLPLASLNGTNGFKLDGEMSSDYSGYSVSTAGDVNGDGYADVLIGAPYHASYTGRSYVVFGGRGVGGNGLLSLANLNGVNGFKLDGEMIGDYSGRSVSAAGDVNGDAYADLLIGTRGHASNTGRSYVVFGGREVGGNGLLPLANLNGTNGFKLDGEVSGDQSGYSVSAAGDFNGDGYTDVLIGAVGHTGSGRSYLMFGGREVGGNGLLPLANLNGTNGFKLDGEVSGDQSGYSVSAAGDFNDDGYADLLISAPSHASNTGRSYLMFGNIDFPSFQLGTNQLTIHQNQTVIMSARFLNTTDSRFPASALWFNVSACQHGYFSQISNPIQPITRFNQSQIWAGQIQFVHDGSSLAPSYDISVTHPKGVATILPQAAAIIFYARLTLTISPFTINQWQSLATTFINVMDDYPTDQVIFTISNLNYARFQLLPFNNSILQFTQSQLLAGKVLFVQDGTPLAPTCTVSVSDPYFELPAQPCIVNFNAAPVIINNRLEIAPGQTVVIGTNNLFASDDKTPTPALIFSVSNVSHGHFALVGQPNLLLTHFTQLQIGISEIVFVAEDGKIAPSYTVTVTNALGLSTLSDPAQVLFNLPSSSTLGDSNPVRNAILGAVLSGVIGLGFFGLQLYIKRKAQQRFEQASAESDGVGQQQADFNKNVIRPVAKAILARIQIAGFMGYVSDQTMHDALSVISGLVHELEQKGVNVDLPSMNATQQHRLLDTIARQTRRILAPDRVCCSPSRLFCPEVTPNQIENNIPEIVAAVKRIAATCRS